MPGGRAFHSLGAGLEKALEPGLPSLTVPTVSVDSSDWEVGGGGASRRDINGKGRHATV